jgi:hypothetical protein
VPKAAPVDGEGDDIPEEDAAEEEEEEDAEKYKPKFQVNIYPDSVILLRGTNAELKAKARKLDPHILKGSHYMDNEMDR